MCCQKLPPTIVTRPGCVTPIPSRPSCVSAPPDHDGRPRAEVRSARPRAAVTAADHRARIDDRWEHRRDRARRARAHASDQLRSASSNMPELEPSDGSVTNSPERLGEDPVAEHPDVRDRIEDLGLVAGDPQEPRRRRDRHPVAGALVDVLRRARLDQLSRLDAGATVDVGARPDLAASRRRRAPCPRACWWRSPP